MSAVKIADLKNNLSRHLAVVRRGGEIVVLDRQTPIARIVPFLRGEKTTHAPGRDHTKSAARIEALARQGVISPGDSRALASWLEDHPPIKRPAGSPSAVDVLLTMRRECTR